MFFLSCVYYAFVSVCLYVPCGHLLGKGGPLGSRLWCPTVSLSLGILGQVWYLIVSIPDLCTLTYFHILFYRTNFRHEHKVFKNKLTTSLLTCTFVRSDTL